MNCFTCTIHGPGFGQQAQPGGMRGKQKIRRAHPSGDGEEHEQNHPARLGEGKAECRSQKRRGAWSREDGGENALEKRTGITFARGPAEQAAVGALRQRNFENAKEIEREHEHDRAHAKNKIGIGELERPGDFVAGRFQADDRQRQSDEPGENSGDKRKSAAQNAPRDFARRAE